MQIDWLAGHEAIFDLLTKQHSSEASTRTDLEPLVQAIYHGCMAGKYLEAFEIFTSQVKRGQITDTALYSHHLDLDCMGPFFSRKWAEPHETLPVESRYYLLLCASANLIYLGDMRNAIEPMSLCIDGFIQQEKWVQACFSATPLAVSMFYSGRLDEAEELLANLDDLSDEGVNTLLNNLITDEGKKNV